ncbi:hypothetical protein CI105_02070 [Candidatus Izimaplasma bacterium ZiA1]|uniref:ECF transporter S component n=1 Tax=Candidatus Izimoplasma sp. ZiA1 TaxID=2024899 RepID=UPI000BAA70FC|nr:hypothetical protein CI105_02070 [Candidatus Izimaplasma bacterium ZiA1]
MFTDTKKLATLGVLTALGAVLMILEIPYPFFDGSLNFELSDVVVLIVLVMYDWKSASLVAILKGIVHILFKGAIGPFAIGQLMAMLASLVYIFSFYLTTNKLNLSKVVGAVITVLIATLVLVVANYVIVIPIYITGEFALFTQVASGDLIGGLNWFYEPGIESNYLGLVAFIFLPFNLIKGVIVMSGYFAVLKVLKELKLVNSDVNKI